MKYISQTTVYFNGLKFKGWYFGETIYLKLYPNNSEKSETFHNFHKEQKSINEVIS